MERHQKTLLSDEFGIGFGGLLAEQLLQTSRFVDIDFALEDPNQYFNVQHVGSRRPDYLFWGPNTPVYVVECKGSQSTWSGVIGQLRRGMEQLPAIAIPGRPTESLVVATYLGSNETRIIVLDPPPDEGEPERPGQSVPEKVSETAWRVREPESFQEKLRIGTNLTLLRWIAQHETARTVGAGLDLDIAGENLPDRPLEMAETGQGDFVGISESLAPEIGAAGPSLFRGIREDVFQALQTGDLTDRIRVQAPNDADSRISVGPSGTCLIVQNLEM